jgi:plasmid stability protein
MTVQTVTVSLPGSLYEQLRARAEQRQRSVADEVLNVLAAAVPVADRLPEDLEQAISPLALLDDTSLWRAARSRLAPEAAERLEALHMKRQREGLTGTEEQEVANLTSQYERSMLVRAQAAALLKERGHDVSSLLNAA